MAKRKTLEVAYNPLDSPNVGGAKKRAIFYTLSMGITFSGGHLQMVKNITAWLDLRNSAAHGDYAAYTKEQVKLLIASVQNFIIRYPA